MARILLVDDEESVLQAVELLLQFEKHDVVSMRDSQKAADLIQAETFDLMITDIRMSPLDGMQLLELSRSARPATPVIVISAYGSESTIQECYKLGCTAYIKKPFKVNEVFDAINQALMTNSAATD